MNTAATVCTLDSNESVWVCQVVCGSAEQAGQLMEAGLKNRAVGSTKMNDVSSRSHLVVSIRVDRSAQLRSKTSLRSLGRNCRTAS